MLAQAEEAQQAVGAINDSLGSSDARYDRHPHCQHRARPARERQR